MDKMIISIHAPTRGATFCSQNQHHAGIISIHAPTRGATQTPPPNRLTPHPISIHAPTRGATILLPDAFSAVTYFNPRSHKGSDDQKDILVLIEDDFNPRSHKGSDTGGSGCCPGYKISIHAPTRGATMSPPALSGTGKQISIHAPTRGATLLNPARPQKGPFQSTLPQGERQQFYTKFHICFISFLPILSPYHISTHSPLPTFNHFLYIFSGANRPEISCLLPFRTKTISGIL